jgi:periplasmic divalent cation tolerance protein
MKSARSFRIVMVTTPDLKSARKLIQVVVKERFAACGNLIPKIESHYWWKGKLEHSAEVLVLFKTPSNHLKSLEALILKNHPYDTPEIIALPLASGNARYLDWITQETDR